MFCRWLDNDKPTHTVACIWPKAFKGCVFRTGSHQSDALERPPLLFHSKGRNCVLAILCSKNLTSPLIAMSFIETPNYCQMLAVPVSQWLTRRSLTSHILHVQVAGTVQAGSIKLLRYLTLQKILEFM